MYIFLFILFDTELAYGYALKSKSNSVLFRLLYDTYMYNVKNYIHILKSRKYSVDSNLNRSQKSIPFPKMEQFFGIALGMGVICVI
jgi:hypothetical protein